MKLGYKRLGDYIQLVDERNRNLKVTNLLGISVTKNFIPSVANIVGTDMANYKIVRKNQFACSIMQVRRDKKMPVALYLEDNPSIISQAYPIFQVIDESVLLPEYLMMWFTRSEFDREACFLAVGGVRGSLEWEDFLNMQLPIPSPEKQKELIEEYEAIENRIQLNKKLCATLEETAQTIYKHWFEDFEFPDENGKPYQSSGGEMVECEELGKEIPKGWRVRKLNETAKVKHGHAFSGESFSEIETDLVLVSPGNFKLNGGFNFSKNKYYVGRYPKDYVLKENDLIINMTDLSKKGDTLGNTAIIPKFQNIILLHNQRVGKFLIESNFTYYIYFLTNSNVFKNYILGSATGTTVRHTSPNRILEYVYVEPVELEITKFNNKVKILYEKINNFEYLNYKLEELKSMLLGKMAVII